MGFKLLLAFALSASLSLASANVASPRDDPLPPMPKDGEGLPIPGYDCSPFRVGNHNHPSECTKFISCNDGGLAYEMDCANCTPGDPRCPEGKTNYNYAADACLWPADAGCSGGGGGTQPPPPPTPEPTEAPTTPGGGGGDETTTDDPGCNPDNCTTTGWCRWYEWCERDVKEGLEGHTGKVHWGHKERGECDPAFNLYFNPNITQHGGTCDFWFNLPQPIKDAYNADPNCVDPHCEWRELEGECNTQYEYYNPDRFGDEVKLETCPQAGHNGEQLYWNHDQKACLHCSQVPKASGGDCC